MDRLFSSVHCSCCGSNDDVITAIHNGDISVFNPIQATTLYKQMPDEKDVCAILLVPM